MGLVNATLILKNPRKPELSEVSVSALADTGSVHLCIPEHIRIQMELEELGKKEITLTRSFEVNPLSPNIATSIVK